MDVDLNACCSGDGRAWAQFVHRTAPIIYAAVRRTLQARGGDLAETDDRVQDVFVRLVRNDFRLLRTFDPARASLSTWLSLVSRSIVREHLRKRRLDTTSLYLDLIPTGQNGHATPELPCVPMDGLTERQRVVLDLLFQQDLSVEQAAARLGVDPQTIRSTKHKALTRLRQAMGLANRPSGTATGNASTPCRPIADDEAHDDVR